MCGCLASWLPACLALAAWLALCWGQQAWTQLPSMHSTLPCPPALPLSRRHAKNLNSDAWRKLQLWKHTANPAHPFARWVGWAKRGRCGLGQRVALFGERWQHVSCCCCSRIPLLPPPLLLSLPLRLRCRFSTGSFDTLITQPKQAGIDPHER